MATKEWHPREEERIRAMIEDELASRRESGVLVKDADPEKWWLEAGQESGPEGSGVWEVVREVEPGVWWFSPDGRVRLEVQDVLKSKKFGKKKVPTGNLMLVVYMSEYAVLGRYKPRKPGSLTERHVSDALDAALSQGVEAMQKGS